LPCTPKDHGGNPSAPEEATMQVDKNCATLRAYEQKYFPLSFLT
jgi:hypothetical protein